MKDFFKKSSRIAGNIVGGVLSLGYIAVHETAHAAEKLTHRLTGKNNGVSATVENTARINIKGLESSIFVPAPTQDDKAFARKHRGDTTYGVVTALKEAAESGKNWRVHYLINRPVRGAHAFSHTYYGFRGNVDLDDALWSASKNDNVTAVYLMLKYAEQKPTHISSLDGKVTDDMRDIEVLGACFRTLRASAEHSADKVTRLLANTIGDFAKAYDRASGEAYESYLQEAVRALIKNRNTLQMDMLLEKGVRPETFVRACEQTFAFNRGYGFEQFVTADDRKAFVDWALSEKVIDAATAQTLTDKEGPEAARVAAAKADGSYYRPQNYSSGIFAPDDDPLGPDVRHIDVSRIDEEQVVMTIVGNGAVAHAFNIAAKTVTVDSTKTISFEDFKLDAKANGPILDFAQKAFDYHVRLRKGAPRRP